MRANFSLFPLLLAAVGSAALADQPPSPPDSFDRQLEAEVSRIEQRAAKETPDKESWLTGRKESRRKLAEMLGLDPMPSRGDLHATKTGEFEHEDIIVENLHYQSLPGLYVTANLYRPKEATGPLPAVLYLCGHSNKVKDGVSYGNKTGYEHHGVWYAKHGFLCLVIDTVQLGEIRGSHKGTYSENRWDWISRGYTPAGVEAWAGIRGIDYLESRTDVDRNKIGVTGRSGGGAYSWWVAALDGRVACAVPTAGITTLRDHVVHQCVAGHCDCMFTVNTYQWDYDRVAELVSPRPLLIANSDKDSIFPIEGVFDIFHRTRAVYRMLGAEKNLGLQVAEGPHADLQPLNTGEFHWMLRHLKGEPATATYDGAAVKSIPMEKLRVFDKLPGDEKNTTIDQSFVPLAETPSPEKWEAAKPAIMKALSEKVFATWPTGDPPHIELAGNRITTDGIVAGKYHLRPLGPGTEPVLDLYLLQPELAEGGKQIILRILDDRGWNDFADQFSPLFPTWFPGRKQGSAPAAAEIEGTEAFLCPRGIGPHAKTGNPKDITQLRRSFYLTGGTLESWQVWDIRAAVNRLRSLPSFQDSSIMIHASGTQAVNSLYASLFEPGINQLDLHAVPSSHLHEDAPAYLNVLKYLDIPQAAALATEKLRVRITTRKPDEWRTAVQLAGKYTGADSKDDRLKLQLLQNDRSGDRSE